MKEFKHINKNIKIYIYDNDLISYSGDKYTINEYFKKLNRKVPNKYGNFYGREKAGATATAELLSKFKSDFIQVK